MVVNKNATHKRLISTQLAKKYRIPPTTVYKVIQGTLDAIINILAKEGRLELRRFGVFLVKTRKARPARNPKTGEPVMIPRRKVVVFKAGAIMHKKIK